MTAARLATRELLEAGFSAEEVLDGVLAELGTATRRDRSIVTVRKSRISGFGGRVMSVHLTVEILNAPMRRVGAVWRGGRRRQGPVRHQI